MFELFKAGRPVLVGLLLAFSAGALQIAHADERYREHEYREHEFHERQYLDGRITTIATIRRTASCSVCCRRATTPCSPSPTRGEGTAVLAVQNGGVLCEGQRPPSPRWERAGGEGDALR